MSEFTGERVIPGQVEDELWAEHIARYAFSARLATGGRVLDLGCGTGYGTAELAKCATEAVGVDVSEEAIDYAKSHYRSARFVQVSALDVPFADASFDIVTSFELIEHLSDWRPLLEQVRRVLHPTGLFIVSTPNRLYYAEARGKSGPNPFHEHEFEYQEFKDALHEYFPHVKMLLQDRMESFAFYEAGSAGDAEASIVRATEDPATANFFVAVCSQEPLPDLRPYLYVPSAGNLLREREQHIQKLDEELGQVRKWLEETTAGRDALLAQQKAIDADREDKAQWARQLQELLEKAQARVIELQDQNAKQQAEAQEIIDTLNADNAKFAKWAQDTDKSLKETVALLDRAEATVVERTQLMQAMETKLDDLRVKLESVRQSRWFKLGRHLGLGPEID